MGRRVQGQLALPPECMSVEMFHVHAWFGKRALLHLVEMVRASQHCISASGECSVEWSTSDWDGAERADSGYDEVAGGCIAHLARRALGQLALYR